MRIQLIRVNNFQRIKSLEIEPGERNLMLIGGKNRQGKTSLLHAMSAALGGGKEKPDQPVRKGEKSAEIVVELVNKETGEEMIVTKTFTDKGKASLKVVTSELGKITSPQVALDTIVGSRFLDPLAFTRLNEKDQRAELLKVVDIDLDLEKNSLDRKVAYSNRTEANRDVRRLTAESGAISRTAEIPERMDMQKLVEQSRVLQLQGFEAVTAKARLDDLCRMHGKREVDVENLVEELANARAALEKAKADHEGKREELSNIASIDVNEEIAAVQASMDECEEHNEKIAKMQYDADMAADIEAQLFDAESKAGELDTEVIALDKAREDALAAAKMPVDGLSLDDSAVLLNGVPLSQASGADEIELSLAIATATSPMLRDIWIQDGSLLDEDSMKTVVKFADDNDLRIWIEVVGENHDDCLIMEDGAIRE